MQSMDNLCNQPQFFYVKFCSQPLILSSAVLFRNVTPNTGRGSLSCKGIKTIGDKLPIVGRL